jgi:hypothetical protein
MKKKILVITASLLLVAMFVTPTMAMENMKNPKKIPIELVRSDSSFITATKAWKTDGNVLHSRGGGIYWDDYNIVDIQNTGAENMSILGGNYTMTGTTNINLNNPGTEITVPGMGTAVFGTGHQIFKVLIDFGGGNTFKGIMTSRGTYIHFTSGLFTGLDEGVSKSVLQGTGIYKGYTIIWQREPIPGPAPGYEYWDAYMLVP